MKAPGRTALALSCWATAACSSSSADRPASADASDQPDASTIIPDSSVSTIGTEAEVASTFLRIAALSPDLPEFDLCFAAHGTSHYEGPFLGQLADDAGGPADATAPGLSYPQISAYFPFPAGQYDVRFVAAGATTCATALVASAPGDAAVADANDSADAATIGATAIPDAVNLPPFAEGTSTTLMILGDVSPSGADAGLRLAALGDDTAPQGALSLRVIHAQPGALALDFGFGSFGAAWTPLFTDVPFGSAGSKAGPSQGLPDANGYLAVALFSDEAVSARLSSGATGDVAIAKNASVDVVGSVATVIAIGRSGDPLHPPALLFCVDSSPTQGALADCTVPP